MTTIRPHEVRAEIDTHMALGSGSSLLESYKSSGLLEQILPELFNCIGVDGGAGHGETVFEHLMGSLEYARKESIRLQWAVLLHDIGKPVAAKEVKKADGTLSTTFHSHEVNGASIAYQMCKRLGFKQKDTEYITTLVRHHMFRFTKDSKDKAIKKWLYKVGKDNWEDLFKLRQADRMGNKAKSGRPAITQKMKELESKVKSFIDSGEVIFREDLQISDDVVKRIVKKQSTHREVYTNLIGLVNSSPERNEPKWLEEYLIRIYGNE